MLIKKKEFKEFDEINVLGYRLNPMSKENILDWLNINITNQNRAVLSYLNFHGMFLMFKSRIMADLLSLKETRIMIDSMPLVFISRLIGYNVSRKYRATSLDFYDDMFDLCVKNNWSIDYVGSESSVLKKGLDILKNKYPTLNIAGRDGYFDIKDWSPSSKQNEVLKWLNERNSDILIVGMGMPRQEEWIYTIKNLIPTRILVSVGAYFDYQSGSLVLPPRWLGQIGMEWFFRLITTPKRLGFRYLIEPFLLLFNLFFKTHPQKNYWETRDKQD